MEIADHTGRKFPSFMAMCAAWGRSAPLVRYRMKEKYWSLEEALTRETRAEKIKRNREKYKIPWSLTFRTINRRLRKGWPEELAYTTEGYTTIKEAIINERKKRTESNSFRKDI